MNRPLDHLRPLHERASAAKWRLVSPDSQPLDTVGEVRSSETPIDLENYQQVIDILYEAYLYAAEAGCDLWEFAVELDTLRDAGVSNRLLQWLVENRYLDHAREITIMTDRRRRFRRSTNTAFSQITCFVLTPIGAGRLGVRISA